MFQFKFMVSLAQGPMTKLREREREREREEEGGDIKIFNPNFFGRGKGLNFICLLTFYKR